MKRTIIFSFTTLLAAGLVSCNHTETTVTVTEQKVCVSDSMQQLIKLDTVQVSNINDQLTLSGQVGYDENKVVKIFPFSSGQVMEVRVTLGDKVTRGQVLAEIKSADIAGNYSDLRSSQSDITIARRELDNARSLYEKGISSERDLTIAKENYEKAITGSRKLKDQIDINGGGHTSSNGTYRITAPVSGYVVEKNLTAGSFIRSDNPASLFTISDLSHVWILANVFEADIPKVKEGYQAQVTALAYPGKVFNGRVEKISEVLDPQNKIMRVRLTLPNEQYLLKPEMFASVVITNMEQSKAVSIPSEAVLFDNSRKFVVVYHSRCDLEIREVEVMKTVGDTTYISSGLKPSEVVISRNQILLYRALLEK